MKALFLLAAGFGLAASSLQAADAAKPVRVEIQFDHPERFTDVKDALMPTEKGRDGILNRLREHLVWQADHFLPPGYRLTMTFTDIDLAGDFEPWLGPLWADVRVVKAIYPPAFKFSWKVTDPAGKVVGQGKEDMRVLDFDMVVTLDHDDPLRYEKAILDDWMREHLKGFKAGMAAN